jgi:hypothetical protein
VAVGYNNNLTLVLVVGKWPASCPATSRAGIDSPLRIEQEARCP